MSHTPSCLFHRYCGSIQTGTIAILALPMSSFATAYGKTSVLCFGTVCFVLICSAYLSFSNGQIGKWKYISPLFCLYERMIFAPMLSMLLVGTRMRALQARP